MSKQKWTYEVKTYALADTGDYEEYVQFTNGRDILQSSGNELEEEQLKQFCELLNCMPDLWSYRCDNAEFELSQTRKKAQYFENTLKTIRDAFWSEGETYEERVADLKAIAFKSLTEVEQRPF